ncbi:MAG TPA: hypothetical protein VG496_15195 [Myxococcales bacterium]|nr:hypothetical protein [Myxococcales bacterium]
MNTPLDAVPPHPRYVVVAVHSWAGSSQSLVAAALDLLAGSDVFEEKKSSILWYEDPSAPSGYHVLGSYALLSAASIAQMQTFLKGVEERLGASGTARLLKTDILWVENARVDTQALKLPNPAIFDTPWGISALLSSAEDPVADACDQGREDKDFCRAIGKAARKPNVVVFETGVDNWIGGDFKDGALECWAYAHARDEEIVGNAVDALLTADVARSRLESRGLQAVHRLALSARDAVTSRRANELFPIEVPASGKIEEKVMAWLKAVSAKALQDRIVVRRAVVFALEPATIRGAIVGTRLVGAVTPVPLVPVSTVEVIRGGGAPREPPAFSVSLRVQPPKIPER